MAGLFFSSELCIADRVNLNGEKVDEALYITNGYDYNYLDLKRTVVESLITKVDPTNYKGEYALANPKPLKSCFQNGMVPNIITREEAYNLLELYKSYNKEETPKTSRL